MCALVTTVVQGGGSFGSYLKICKLSRPCEVFSWDLMLSLSRRSKQLSKGECFVLSSVSLSAY